MSNIVIDARESGTSTGRYVDKLIEHLYQLKPQHDITVLAKPHRVDYIGSIAPSFTVVASPFKEFTFTEQFGLKKQLQGLAPDLVHFGKDHQPILYRGRVVTTMHDLTTARFRNPAKPWRAFKLKQQVYRQVVKRVARKSLYVLTPTQFVKDDLVRFTHINPAKITVTLEAADAIRDTATPVASVAGKQFIMYVGRPTPHKNLGRLIDAFSELQKDRPDLWLVLAGKKDANYEGHARAVAARDIQRVIFTDFTTEGQLRWLYENCKAYIFSSLSEGFGLPGLEAMLHGAPVVSSNATCLPEVYGDAACYFDPLDVADMAAKISEVLDDPILREDLCEKGTLQAAKYSWLRMAEQTLAIYDQAVSQK